MGFFSDLWKLMSSTGSAIGEGMELMAQGAEELNRGARRLNLETRIWALEHERERVGDDWFTPSNKDKHKELREAYAELVRDYPADSTTEARANLAKLNSDSDNH
jgi:hypothetical protein